MKYDATAKLRYIPNIGVRVPRDDVRRSNEIR